MVRKKKKKRKARPVAINLLVDLFMLLVRAARNRNFTLSRAFKYNTTAW